MKVVLFIILFTLSFSSSFSNSKESVVKKPSCDELFGMVILGKLKDVLTYKNFQKFDEETKDFPTEERERLEEERRFKFYQRDCDKDLSEIIEKTRSTYKECKQARSGSSPDSFFGIGGKEGGEFDLIENVTGIESRCPEVVSENIESVKRESRSLAKASSGISAKELCRKGVVTLQNLVDQGRARLKKCEADNNKDKSNKTK